MNKVNEKRTITCIKCKKTILVTPRQSHYITQCRACYLGLGTGICLIQDSDSE